MMSIFTNVHYEGTPTANYLVKFIAGYGSTVVIHSDSDFTARLCILSTDQEKIHQAGLSSFTEIIENGDPVTLDQDNNTQVIPSSAPYAVKFISAAGSVRVGVVNV